MPVKPVVDTLGHVWKRDADGDVDLFVLDNGNHNGPGCVKCDYVYCHHCQEPSEPCNGVTDAA